MRTLLALALLLGACGEPPPAYVYQCETPVIVALNTDVPEAWQSHAADAVSAWNDAAGQELYAFQSEPIAPAAGLPVDKAVLERGRWGNTVTLNDGPCITHARIDLAVDKIPNTDAARLVLLHELGHGLGLEHAPADVPTLMSARLTDMPIGDWERAELARRYR